MFEKTEAGDYLPDEGRVLFTCKNGGIYSIRPVHNDEHVASLNTLMELLRTAGYTVLEKDASEV